MLTLTCKRAAVLLSAAMEHGLPLRARLLLRLHLLACAACMRFKLQLLILRRAIRLRACRVDTQTVADGTALSPAARARLKRALRDNEH
ncbi:MAG: zf-HC2 domain-containing protein [Pyrinomonadaceae bacterium]